jgi:hypothetical protein
MSAVEGRRRKTRRNKRKNSKKSRKATGYRGGAIFELPNATWLGAPSPEDYVDVEKKKSDSWFPESGNEGGGRRRKTRRNNRKSRRKTARRRK